MRVHIPQEKEGLGDFSCLFVWHSFSALALLVGWQGGDQVCKKLSGGMLAWLCVWVKVQICI